MSTLLELVRTSEDLANKLIELGGEVDKDTEIQLAMNGIELKVKFDNYGFIIDQLKLRQEYALAKMKEWDVLASQCEKALDNLKDRILTAMDAMNIDEVHGYDYTVRTQLNNPKCEITDEKLIPDQYKILKTEVVIDKKALLEDLKESRVIPGAKISRSKRLVTKISQRKDLLK